MVPRSPRSLSVVRTYRTGRTPFTGAQRGVPGEGGVQFCGAERGPLRVLWVLWAGSDALWDR